MGFINPFNSEASFRFYLSKLKEFNDLDYLIKFYVENILGHRIYQRPSKGPYGEKGKDIVAIENESTLEYCSYIIKCGTLHKNLDGQFGIINQMEEAISIELEEEKYKRRKRTVIVIHNGEEGYRGAIKKFEDNRLLTQSNIENDLLLRDIERWDISVLCQKLFPHIDKLIEIENIANGLNRQFAAIELVRHFSNESNKLNLDENNNIPLNNIVKNTLNKIKDIEDKYGRF